MTVQNLDNSWHLPTGELTKSKGAGASNALGRLDACRGVESRHQQAVKEGAC